MHAKLILVSLLSIGPCAVFAPFPVQAQTKQSVWDGVYTDAQAERGRAQYAAHCAMCHGPALEGNGEAPPLTGEFIPDWAGMTLADLTDKIRITMPLNAPGTLSPAAAADILAYILKANNFPMGSKELGPGTDLLSAISFDVSKAKPVAAAQLKSTPK
ncbi:MAG TPA: cytochrome c [Rhizomicrobium sp.]|jgi:mono/diheme cytochrome c family protein|nr:cytochrome c [Rhizomicrobium sp.]